MSSARSVRQAPGHTPRERSPREDRLLQAVVHEVAQHGYQATTIAQITARARVSRTTFYEHFTDKQHCFLASYRELAGPLATTVEEALDEGKHTDTAATVLGALFELAHRDTNAALILVHEPAAAGRAALEERNRLLSRIERAMEVAGSATPTDAPTPNLPARALIGAAVRELAMRLHRREDTRELLAELIRWSESYTRTSPAAPAAARTQPQCETIAAGGRRGPHPSPRERIVRAVARLAQHDGYTPITVADIAAAAGVNRETFYRHFAGKQSAYIAALELVFERALAATAQSFFERTDWSERVWSGLRGLAEFLTSERALAQVALAEPYALATDAIDVVIDKQLAFTLFLEDGYRCKSGAEHTPRVTSNLIACAIFELLDRQLRERPEDSLTILLPQVAYIALAPFIGADAAAAFVERKARRRHA